MDTSNRAGGAPSPRSWRTPGFVIACGCLIAMLAFGPRSSMGLFTAPLSEAHGWGRDVFALSIAIQNLVWGIGTPFAGALCDRYGPALVLGISGILYALGLALMPYADTPLMLHLSSGLLIGLGLAGASFGIVIAGFSRIVPPEKRSWSMGVATAAGSMGQFLFAPTGQAFIAAYGWQTALILFGASMLMIPVLASSFAGAGGSKSAQAVTGADTGFAARIRQAFQPPSYVLLCTGFFVRGPPPALPPPPPP
ncbi:MFS transporter, partial [Azospirillum brasilense]|nr:MFS transporter [Azospirillum brasilense]